MVRSTAFLAAFWLTRAAFALSPLAASEHDAQARRVEAAADPAQQEDALPSTRDVLADLDVLNARGVTVAEAVKREQHPAPGARGGGIADAVERAQPPASEERGVRVADSLEREQPPAPDARGVRLTDGAEGEHPPASEERGVRLTDGAEGEHPPKRYSTLSAGSGGVWFFVTQAVVGSVTGTLIGSVVGARGQELYPWFLGGGLALGALGAVFQYFHPIGGATAGISALGAGVGITAGMGMVLALGVTAPLPTTLLLAASMEIGALLPVALAWNREDLSSSDLALVSSGSVYGVVLTSLAILYARGTGTLISPTVPLLVSPAAGMLLGGMLAAFFEPPAWSVFALTAAPIGAGLVLAGYGLILQVPLHKVAATTLIGMGVTAVGTLLLTQPWKESVQDEPRATKARAPRVMPTAVVGIPIRQGDAPPVVPGVFGVL